MYLSHLPSLCALFFFYSSRAHRALHSFPTRRSSDLVRGPDEGERLGDETSDLDELVVGDRHSLDRLPALRDRKSTRLNSSHVEISYAVFCLKKKNRPITTATAPLQTVHNLTVGPGPS